MPPLYRLRLVYRPIFRDLVAAVRGEVNPLDADAARYARYHPLGQVHGVGYGRHHEPRTRLREPFEDTVKNGLSGCNKAVYLVYEEYSHWGRGPSSFEEARNLRVSLAFNKLRATAALSILSSFV